MKYLAIVLALVLPACGGSDTPDRGAPAPEACVDGTLEIRRPGTALVRALYPEGEAGRLLASRSDPATFVEVQARSWLAFHFYEATGELAWIRVEDAATGIALCPVSVEVAALDLQPTPLVD